MSENKTVMIPKEVAEELVKTMNEFQEDGLDLVMLKLCKNSKIDNWLKIKGNITKLAAAIEHGYWIQEEALLIKYNESKRIAEQQQESWYIGHVEGITDTLEFLGIKIQGINE